MKNKILILVTCVLMGCLFTHAQTNSPSRLTEQQLPYRSRDTYISQAKRYLRNYYEQLFLNVQDGMVQESFIRNHMDADQKRYMPEFLLQSPKNGQYIQPDQYLMELDKQFTSFNLDNLQLKVDLNSAIKKTDKIQTVDTK